MNPQRAESHCPESGGDWSDNDADDNPGIGHPLPDTGQHLNRITHRLAGIPFVALDHVLLFDF